MTLPSDPSPAEESLRLREYLQVLRIRKWSILFVTIVATLAAFVFAKSQQAVYTSTAQVLVKDPIAAFEPFPTQASVTMGTEEALLLSSQVQDCAWQFYRFPAGDGSKICGNQELATVKPPTWFTTSIAPGAIQLTNILEIGFTDTKAARAQQGAEAYAQAYVTIKTLKAGAYVDALRKAPLAQEASLNAKIARQQSKVNRDISAGNQAQFAADNARLTQLNNQLAGVQQTLLQADPARITPPTIALDAPLPTKPSNTLLKELAVAAGFLLGLAVGIVQAYLRHRLNDRLRGRADLETSLGAPVLAAIPRFKQWRRRSRTHVVTLEAPQSPVAEAYRTLRTGILHAASQRGLKSIMVTSPTAGEGKTATAINLAVVLAQTDKRVILVSCDLRKPRAAKFFGLQEDRGVTSVLTGKMKSYEALQNTQVPTLRLLGSGPTPDRPSEMMESDGMKELLAELKSVADFIVIDSAPLLLVADALALSPSVDGILFVADGSSTSRSAVLRARDELAQIEAPVIGAVLNNFEPSKAVEYPYSTAYHSRRYQYGYRAPQDVPARASSGFGFGEPAPAPALAAEQLPPEPALDENPS